MIVLGLTGSVGMGKSTATRLLRRCGIPVHDADAAVHRLLARGGGAVAPVAAAFPEALRDGAIDRSALGKRVFGDPAALRQLESILHPLVRRSERGFLSRARRSRRAVAVLDIPLLFETGGERRCDAVLVVSAPRRIQLARVLGRPGMSVARLAGIEARQMNDAEKRRRADFVIATGLSRRHSLAQLCRALKRIRERGHA
jgi:dephospho-CoA kinase